MKILKSFFLSSFVAALSLGFVSCSDDDNDGPVYLVLDFNKEGIEMNDETKAWSEVFNPEYDNALVYGGFQFSHSANAQYKSYSGFCPTMSSDNADHDGDYTYQWSSITGCSVIAGSPYMMAYWSEYDDTKESGIPAKPSCSIKCDRLFNPVGVYITNSAYAYYAIKNGTEFSSKFENGDYFTLHINGVRNGVLTGHVDVELANGTNILSKWLPVSLESLGTVDMIYFTMESSDSGTYGMNTPSYFCLDGFTFEFVKE